MSKTYLLLNCGKKTHMGDHKICQTALKRKDVQDSFETWCRLFGKEYCCVIKFKDGKKPIKYIDRLKRTNKHVRFFTEEQVPFG